MKTYEYQIALRDAPLRASRFEFQPATLHLSVGPLVKHYRQKKGLTIKGLADRVSRSRSLMSRIESGEVRLQRAMRMDLERVLGLDANLLLLAAFADEAKRESADQEFTDRLGAALVALAAEVAR